MTEIINKQDKDVTTPDSNKVGNKFQIQFG